jgi:hypothetical protein
MPTIETRVKELIHFYVKTNYENYLTERSIKVIPEADIPTIVTELYTNRKDHLRVFIKESLKQLMGRDYPGDLPVLNILVSVFEDDQLCVNRLIMEITVYQEQFSRNNM